MRLRLEGPTTHIIVLGWLQQRVPPDRTEEALVRRFADQAALALERAAVDRLHGRLEASLLPRLPIAHPTLRVHARYRTGESRLGIGGDFFDFLPTEGAGAAFLIGDVSGRGVDAAALGAGLRATWRALTLAETGRELLVTTMAEALSREAGDPGLFTTVLLGDVAPDGHEVTFLNFGHQPPLLMAGSVRELQIARTLPLGLWTGSPWPSTTVTLPRSWKLFLYTDGLIEGLAAPTGEERYGVERLKADLQRVGMADGGDAALDRLLAEVEAANGGELLDDVAILTIEDTRP
jgi:serine phosphatase RsbU (regulator of sigma subunit)